MEKYPTSPLDAPPKIADENFCSSLSRWQFPFLHPSKPRDTTIFRGGVRIVATRLPVGDSLFSASRSHPSSPTPSPFIARGTRTKTRKTRLRPGISIQPLLLLPFRSPLIDIGQLCPISLGRRIIISVIPPPPRNRD